MAAMDALQFDKLGEPAEVLQLRQVPKPALKGDSGYVLKCAFGAINPSDLLFVKGQYGVKPQQFPCAAGFEGSGVVEEAGKDSGLKAGQRVHVAFVIGSWGEYLSLDVKTTPAVPLPDTVSLEDGAQLTVNPTTVLAMFDVLGLKQGDYVVQTAASSSLGRILIQIAKIKGYKTINIVRRDEHIPALKAIGADHVINSEKGDLAAQIKQAAPEGVKYAIDAVGGKLTRELAHGLSYGGKILVYGILSGGPTEVDGEDFIFKQLSVTGFWLSPYIKNNFETFKKSYGELLQMLATKQLKLETKIFDGRTQFKEATKHSETPGKAEKTLLKW